MKKVVVILLALVAVGVLMAGQPAPDVAATHAKSPPRPKPLVSCSDMTGDGRVRGIDITAVVTAFANDAGPGWPYEVSNAYKFLYDRDANGALRGPDIGIVVGDYGMDCPLVDAQVAKATLWAYANAPVKESEAALEALGYYQASTDVPGQGTHYAKLEDWDGVFDPEAPEGLVYHHGRLAAQLYVVDGDAVGWGDYEATSYPPPETPHEVDLEGDADGPACDPDCSWNGTDDGWHLHYYLCTYNIGTSGATALPGTATAQACATAGGGDPPCTVPVTTQPCYRWGQNVGWMGHLWNHLPNLNIVEDGVTPNQICSDGDDNDNDTFIDGADTDCQGGNPPGEGGSCSDGVDNESDGVTDAADPDCQNGRFVDCFPDTQDGDHWAPFNCPA